MLPPIVDTMIGACKHTASAITRDFMEIEKLQVSHKSIGNFVTNADLKAEKLLINTLRHARPSYEMLVEESGFVPASQASNTKQSVRYRWIVDPIDGTSNFIHGHPCFGISIALERVAYDEEWVNSNLPIFSKRVIAGVIYLPVTREVYWAERGSGAYHINNNGVQSRLRAATPRSNYNEMLAGTLLTNETSQEYAALYQKFSSQYCKFRVSGCVVSDLGLLASGKLDFVFYDKLHLWDIAAGMIILKEAHYTVSTFQPKVEYTQQPAKSDQDISERDSMTIYGFIAGPAHTLSTATK